MLPIFRFSKTLTYRFIEKDSYVMKSNKMKAVEEVLVDIFLIFRMEKHGARVAVEQFNNLFCITNRN